MRTILVICLLIGLGSSVIFMVYRVAALHGRESVSQARSHPVEAGHDRVVSTDVRVTEPLSGEELADSYITLDDGSIHHLDTLAVSHDEIVIRNRTSVYMSSPDNYTTVYAGSIYVEKGSLLQINGLDIGDDDSSRSTAIQSTLVPCLEIDLDDFQIN